MPIGSYVVSHFSLLTIYLSHLIAYNLFLFFCWSFHLGRSVFSSFLFTLFWLAAKKCCKPARTGRYVQAGNGFNIFFLLHTFCLAQQKVLQKVRLVGTLEFVLLSSVFALMATKLVALSVLLRHGNHGQSQKLKSYNSPLSQRTVLLLEFTFGVQSTALR